MRLLVVEDPATTDEIADLEKTLGRQLPASYRSVLTTVSRHVDFRWFGPKPTTFAAPFDEIFSGNLNWSIDDAAYYSKDVQAWIEELFTDPNDPYDAVWHHKLPVCAVGNGDYIAVDIHESADEEMVYLSHDGGNGHGHVLAADFDDLLDRWVPLACPGGEDWQWIPFTADRTSMIDPKGTAGKAWRALLGLDKLS